MTVEDCITTLMDRIRGDRYAGRDREFLRDSRFLQQAIARYGAECDRRGWEFEAAKIWAEINKVLDTMRDRAVRVWFPRYLEAAIDRSVRLRAEELSREAKEVAPKVTRVVSRTQGVVVVEKTDVEVFAILYRALARQKPKHAGGRKPAEPQLNLM